MGGIWGRSSIGLGVSLIETRLAMIGGGGGGGNHDWCALSESLVS
jgi:hypothetical protein